MKIQLELFEKEHPALERTFTSLEKSIDSVSTLVYDLLRLSRLETGFEQFTPTRLDLSETIREFVEYVKTIASAQSVGIRDSVEPGLFIMGDKKELMSLVTNIAGNSFKYMKGEKPNTLAVSLRRHEDTACIAIEDTGIGIENKDLPKIFDRFYRAQTEDTRKTKGSGLGLAIAKKIVERHGGTISIASEVGKGTIVTMCLPILK